MRQKSLPSWEYLNECFNYDPDTGVLSWKTRPVHHFKPPYLNRWNVKNAGNIVSTISHYGYIVVGIDGVKHPAHRVIFKLMTGLDPAEYIDHINNIKNDNRWSNLREATQSENERNRPVDRDNVAGLKGVTFHKLKNKYSARIAVNGEHIYLGIYDSAEEAHAVFVDASLKYHGDFAYYANN